MRLCLWAAAGIRSNPDDGKHTEQLNTYIRQNYQSSPDNALQNYLEFIKRILRAKRGLIELSCVYDLLNAEKSSLTEQCFDLIATLGLALKDVSEATRIVVAKVVGILWSASDESVFNEQVMQRTFASNIINVFNCSLAHCHFISRPKAH